MLSVLGRVVVRGQRPLPVLDEAVHRLVELGLIECHEIIERTASRCPNRGLRRAQRLVHCGQQRQRLGIGTGFAGENAETAPARPSRPALRTCVAVFPACNPSRVALLTGRNPSATGVYGNRSEWRRALPEAITPPRYCMNHGYRVEGPGKIVHQRCNSPFHDDESFHRFEKMQLDPMPTRKSNGIARWLPACRLHDHRAWV